MQQEAAIREQQEAQKKANEMELLDKQEKGKRETQRQNIMIGMSMMSQQLSSAFQNPGNFFKLLYYGSAGYATYHVLRIVMMGMSRSVMGRFGKPQLVRETSKLHTNNYLTIPYLQMRKFYHGMKRRS